jgi:hypothetical protein
MRALGIRPFIRRFRELAGCTLIPEQTDLIFVEFGDVMAHARQAFHDLMETRGVGTPGLTAWLALAQPFHELNYCLGGTDALGASRDPV